MADSKLYVGAKFIRAVPQAHGEHAGYRVIYPDGYESWSPKKTLEAAYREVSFEERSLF